MKGPVFGRKTTENVKICEDVEKAAWNIREALMTQKGSRPCLPEFGSSLHKLRFELLDDAFIDLCKIFISQSVSASVAGVSVKNIVAKQSDEHSVKFDIIFQIDASGLIGSYSMSFNDGKWQM